MNRKERGLFNNKQWQLIQVTGTSFRNIHRSGHQPFCFPNRPPRRTSNMHSGTFWRSQIWRRWLRQCPWGVTYADSLSENFKMQNWETIIYVHGNFVSGLFIVLFFLCNSSEWLAIIFYFNKPGESSWVVPFCGLSVIIFKILADLPTTTKIPLNHSLLPS